MLQRSEFDANEGQARFAIETQAAAMARESEREDWRKVLGDRDARRDARRAGPKRDDRRTARRSHPRNMQGNATLVAMVQAFAVACAVAIARGFGG